MKKLLALLLSLVMVLSLVPNVWGTDGAQPEETPPETVKTEETAELQETIEAEETVNVPALQADESGEESVITRLKKAGYTAPEKSEIHIMFPDALEYGVKFVTPSFSPFTITCEPLQGDINGDGMVNGSDMQCLYEYLTTGSSTSPLSGKLLEAGLNVNKAGSIDVYDLQRLYEFINGINPNW